MVGQAPSGPIVQDPSDHGPHSALWSHPLPEGPPGLGRGPGRGGRAGRFQRPLKQPATLAASLTPPPTPSPLPLLTAGTEHTSPTGRHWWWMLAEAWGWPEEGQLHGSSRPSQGQGKLPMPRGHPTMACLRGSEPIGGACGTPNPHGARHGSEWRLRLLICEIGPTARPWDLPTGKTAPYKAWCSLSRTPRRGPRQPSHG